MKACHPDLLSLPTVCPVRPSALQAQIKSSSHILSVPDGQYLAIDVWLRLILLVLQVARISMGYEIPVAAIKIKARNESSTVGDNATCLYRLPPPPLPVVAKLKFLAKL